MKRSALIGMLIDSMVVEFLSLRCCYCHYKRYHRSFKYTQPYVYVRITRRMFIHCNINYYYIQLSKFLHSCISLDENVSYETPEIWLHVGNIIELSRFFLSFLSRFFLFCFPWDFVYDNKKTIDCMWLSGNSICFMDPRLPPMFPSASPREYILIEKFGFYTVTCYTQFTTLDNSHAKLQHCSSLRKHRIEQK
jgi:hypothetical protein